MGGSYGRETIMGVIKAAIEYNDSIDNLRQTINKLEDMVCLNVTDNQLMRELFNETYLLRKQVDWLDDYKDALFEAIDEALEDR